MKESKHKQLMAAARKVPPVQVPADFGDNVLRAIHRDERIDAGPVSSVTEQMAALFPRLAAAALVIIIAAAAFDFLAGDDVVLQLTEASDQWLLPLDWL